MYPKLSLALTALFLHEVWALSMRYPLCLAEPALTLEAGKSSLSAIVHSPMETRCEATMYFSDPSFLPVRYSFEALACDGGQVLKFKVPEESPNGDVDVIWQCTGLAPSCNHGVIFSGSADSSIPSDPTGQVGCLVETFETKTTLVTVTRSSSTFVETAPTVLVTSSTSFLSTLTETTEKLGTTDTTTTKAVKRIDTDASDGTTLETPTTLTSTIALAAETTVAAETTEPEPTGDGVFVSTASRTSTTLVPVITASIVSTLTVYHTVTARCTAP
ncbi:hypothetical protein ACJZ2D_016765 [Fusarium nematophilum]